jgi:hypothetical protein
MKWPTKPLRTLIAIKRFLSTIHFDMLLQLMTKSKSLHTNRTFKMVFPQCDIKCVSVMHLVQEMTSHIGNSRRVSFPDEELWQDEL